ncbi:MAG: hypothetical protein K2N31_07855 [Treponemataceae bacterium]|nr:hypothetical protein [Treponemataceae bacterium]
MKKKIFLGFFLMVVMTSLVIAVPTVDSVIREYNSVSNDIESFTRRFKSNPEQFADAMKSKLISIEQKYANLCSDANYVASSGVSLTSQQENNLKKAALRFERACNNLNAAFKQYEASH